MDEQDIQDIQDTDCPILSILSINVNFRKLWKFPNCRVG